MLAAVFAVIDAAACCVEFLTRLALAAALARSAAAIKSFASSLTAQLCMTLVLVGTARSSSNLPLPTPPAAEAPAADAAATDAATGEAGAVPATDAAAAAAAAPAAAK